MMNYFKDNTEPNDEATNIMPIVAEIKIIDTEEEDSKEIETTDMPILALRNMVLFPNVTLPVAVGRQKSLNLITEAYRLKKPIGVVCQRNGNTEDPSLDELYSVGVVADIIKILELPDNSTNVILQGRGRFKLENITTTHPYLKGEIASID